MNVQKKRVTIRFTPASAGNTSDDAGNVTELKVHPRLRGEYPIADCMIKAHLGSPPPPRGILIDRATIVNGHGFTPASAGNTR